MDLLKTVPLIFFLAFLESVLSVDNAVVLAMLAGRLPHAQQKRALTYGLLGAVILRLILLTLIIHFIHWQWIKFAGGGYLLVLALRQLFAKKEHGKSAHQIVSFWRAVLVIEFTDLIFAFDSILAAVAISTNYWIVFTGGLIGIVVVRFSASGMVSLLKKYPKLEKTGYFLVLLIGVKLLIDGLELNNFDFQSPESPAFWVFWSLMAFTVIYGTISSAFFQKKHTGV